MQPKLDYVRYQTTGGKLYAYFDTGKKKPNGKPLRLPLPSPSSGSFFQSYGAMKAARENRDKTPGYTFAAMIRDYKDSEAYRLKLSEGSRKAYRSILTPAEQLLGDCAVDAMEPGMIRLILAEKDDWGAGKKNLFVGAIGAVYKWGRKANKTTAHPAKEIDREETGEHKAWPDDAVELGLAAKGRVGLAITLLLYTGQRIGDVCKMRWADIKDGSIKVVQQKTGKPLTIPLHRDLRAALERHGKQGVNLLAGENGKPVGTQPIRDEIKAFVAGIGHADLRPHGLRKNAVIALLRAGCTVAQVAAITGQTYQLVEYYARQIDQEAMADAAILKWEQSTPMQSRIKNSG